MDEVKKLPSHRSGKTVSRQRFAKTHAADQPGVLIHGSESEGQQHRSQEPEERMRDNEEEKPREEHENCQDEDRGETGQQERMSDDAAQRQSDVCDKPGKRDKGTQSHEQEVFEEMTSQEFEKEGVRRRVKRLGRTRWIGRW